MWVDYKTCPNKKEKTVLSQHTDNELTIIASDSESVSD